MPLRTLNCAIDFLARVDHRLLAGDARDLVGAGVDDLGVLRRFAEPHVDDDLLDLRDRHHVAVAELLLQRRHDFLLVPFLQAAHLSTTPSHLRQMRTLRPSPRSWLADPGRLAALGADQLHVRRVQRRLALDQPALDVALRVRLGVALDDVHALDDQRGSSPARTFSTRPRLPRSLPVDDDDVVVLPNGCC